MYVHATHLLLLTDGGLTGYLCVYCRQIERDPDPENTKQRAKHFEALVKVKEKKDMDPIYNELIRGGTSSKQRRKQPHYANMGTAEPDQRDTHLAKTLGIDVASSTSKDTDTKAQEGQE